VVKDVLRKIKRGWQENHDRQYFGKPHKKKKKTQGELSLADFPASRGAKLEGMQVSSPHVHIILQYHVGTIVASI